MNEIIINTDESKKAKLFINFFVNHLLPHVDYSNKQYGDSDVDIVSKWSVDECLVNIDRYRKRFRQNSRPGQEKLDIIKMVDYWIRIFYKETKLTKTRWQIIIEKLIEEKDNLNLSDELKILLKEY